MTWCNIGDLLRPYTLVSSRIFLNPEPSRGVPSRTFSAPRCGLELVQRAGGSVSKHRRRSHSAWTLFPARIDPRRTLRGACRGRNCTFGLTLARNPDACDLSVGISGWYCRFNQDAGKRVPTTWGTSAEIALGRCVCSLERKERATRAGSRPPGPTLNRPSSR